MNTDIEKVEASGEKVRVVFKDGRSMEFDYVFYCLGGRSPVGFLRHIGIEFSDDGKPLVDEYLETNLPGVFLVGDIAVSRGNIALAFSTAHKVVQRIKEKYLDFK
jgi:thioredoxin reductase (NADPH)